MRSSWDAVSVSVISPASLLSVTLRRDRAADDMAVGEIRPEWCSNSRATLIQDAAIAVSSQCTPAPACLLELEVVCAVLTRGDGRGVTGRAGADHDDVDRVAEVHGQVGGARAE